MALAGACGSSLVSSSEPDGSTPDSGAQLGDGGDDAGWDAGQPGEDGGRDAGRIEDAGTEDAGSKDAGSKDAGVDDAGAGDSGFDAGSVADWNGISFVLDGGQLASLDFGDVGDTRPPIYDDISQYPTQVITTIFQDLAGLSPALAFVVSSGDYMFADPLNLFGNQAQAQAQLYVGAGQNFPRQVYPSMGNHECGWSNSNDNCFGQTTNPNYNAYLQNILGGFGLPNQNPYFVVLFASADVTRPWSAKFIYIAPDWWDTSGDTQGIWLKAVLAEPTTYTFLVRHQPTNNSAGAAGIAESDTLLQTYPFTIKLTGHSHSFMYDQTNREIINGVGGAALDTGYNGTFGYVVCRQRADMAIQCTLYDYDSNAVSSEPNATLAVEPDGTPTPPI
ncbi:MAG: metallophosphoesterase [Myxococcales bacterium]